MPHWIHATAETIGWLVVILLAIAGLVALSVIDLDRNAPPRPADLPPLGGEIES